ncbi:hypothetical protein L3Q82_007423 [Scortum barcoo]|uniref:Uncharacterized protein n=1 Tax=Scortum barcoo TaxID=214431 RepID=A0ACB8WSA4_9TELE|nr:hypothetical protein L3Q82_007423 [Scortum barcoo]
MQTQQAPTAHHPSPRWAAQITTWSICALFTHLHTYGEETAPPNKRRVKQWSEEASDALRDCFDTTDWEVLCGPHEQDINSLTDCITDYINFCVETTVPTKRVRCFSNNKPWVTPDLRALLQEKRRAFQSGDRDELRRVQRDLKLKWKIKECKASYRRKMEDHLQQNNAREVWRGLQAISGQGKNERRNPEPGDRDWANKLNLFFNRFDTGPTSSSPLSLSTDQPTSSSLCLHAPSPPSTPPPSLGLSPSPPPSPPSLQCSSPPPPPSPNLFTPTVDQVRTQLKKIKARKATGPDGISSRLLQGLCRPALSGGLLHLQPEPESGKSSCPVEDFLCGSSP